MIHGSSPCEFPHSEICGSKLICSSPQLIAACHVLHRLLMPRHSPCALVRLNFLSLFFYLLNCLSFLTNIFSVINSSVKRFYPFAFLNLLHLSVKLYFTQIFRKDLLEFDLTNLNLNPFLSLSSYLFVSTLQYTLFGFQWTYMRTTKLLAWWAQVDSNHRPRAYQARALTTWAMSPCKFRCISFLSRVWWRWWESNPWPPACRAGALPAELHPHF